MANGMRTVLTLERRADFLATIASGKSVTAACAAVNVSRTQAYDARNDDADFAAAWDDAIEAGTDCLEDAAVDRGKEKSDILLLATLRARRPSKWTYRPDAPGAGPNNATDSAVVTEFRLPENGR